MVGSVGRNTSESEHKEANNNNKNYSHSLTTKESWGEREKITRSENFS